MNNKNIIGTRCFIYKEDSVLLIKSPRRGWEMPGGISKKDESIKESVIREVKEETGYDVALNELFAIYNQRTTGAFCQVHFSYIGKIVGGELKTSEESTEITWYKFENAITIVQDKLQNLKLKHAINYLADKRLKYAVFDETPFCIHLETEE